MNDDSDDELVFVSMISAKSKGKRRAEIEIIDLIESSEDEARPVPKKLPQKEGSSSQKEPLFLPSDEENVPTRIDMPTDPPANESVDPFDRVDEFAANIFDIVPDVSHEYLIERISARIADFGANVVESVLHDLFEQPYPKAAKRKRDGEVEGETSHQRRKIDYASLEREAQNEVYKEMALEQLQLDFPLMPKDHIQKHLSAHKFLYAPTFTFLSTPSNSEYIPNSTPFLGKGKGRVLSDDHFDRELAWVQTRQEATEDDNGIECGCCFTSYPFMAMIQCPDAHLFCASCIRTYAANLLGQRNAQLTCMDQSGCKLAFSDSELQRALDEKLVALYDRIKQAKDIEMADIDGLEECPFCEYKVVIDNPDEKLFRCAREEECGLVSCRKCKKADHLPKGCQEVEEDKVLDGRHVIEEAMAKALMRNCPRCQKAFVKDGGCNAITCSNCRAVSCYVCRALVMGNYNHFSISIDGRKPCGMYDDESFLDEEVKAAAEKATAEYKAAHPEVDEKKIKVDLPPKRPQPFRPLPGRGIMLPRPVYDPGLEAQVLQRNAALAENRLQAYLNARRDFDAVQRASASPRIPQHAHRPRSVPARNNQNTTTSAAPLLRPATEQYEFAMWGRGVRPVAGGSRTNAPPAAARTVGLDDAEWPWEEQEEWE